MDFIRGGLLKDADHQKIKRAIPKASNKLVETGVARLYVAYPDPTQWTWTGLMGAVCLVDDLVGHTWYLKLVDIEGNAGVLWDQELYVNFQYNQDRTFFHSFDLEDCQAGLLFEDRHEAAKFIKKVNGRAKFASKATANNKQAITRATAQAQPPQAPHGLTSPIGNAAAGSPHVAAPISAFKTRPKTTVFYDGEVPLEWRELYTELFALGVTEDMIAANTDFCKDYIRQYGGPLVGLDPPVPRRFSARAAIQAPSQPAAASSASSRRAPPPPPPPPVGASKVESNESSPAPPYTPESLEPEEPEESQEQEPQRRSVPPAVVKRNVPPAPTPRANPVPPLPSQAASAPPAPSAPVAPPPRFSQPPGGSSDSISSASASPAPTAPPAAPPRGIAQAPAAPPRAVPAPPAAPPRATPAAPPAAPPRQVPAPPPAPAAPPKGPTVPAVPPAAPPMAPAVPAAPAAPVTPQEGEPAGYNALMASITQTGGSSSLRKTGSNPANTPSAAQQVEAPPAHIAAAPVATPAAPAVPAAPPRAVPATPPAPPRGVPAQPGAGAPPAPPRQVPAPPTRQVPAPPGAPAAPPAAPPMAPPMGAVPPAAPAAPPAAPPRAPAAPPAAPPMGSPMASAPPAAPPMAPAAPAAPPMAPPAPSAPAAAAPGGDSDGYNALMASITQTDKSSQLRKTDKGHLDRPTALPETAPAAAGPGGAPNMASAIAAALSQRRKGVQGSDDEDDDEEWD